MQSSQQDDFISEEEARRRELLALARRPSYRKILSDLEGLDRNFQPKIETVCETIVEEANEARTSTFPQSPTLNESSSTSNSPASQHEDANFDSGPPTASNIEHALTLMRENGNGRLQFSKLPPSALLQYAQQTQQVNNSTLLLPLNGDVLALKALADGQVLLGQRGPALGVDVLQSASGLLLQSPATAGSVSSQSTGPSGSPTLSARSTANGSSLAGGPSGRPSSAARSGDDPQKKRAVRLMKNREAAKECRRKKKEYIKCLENRVNTLEHQNTQLIEELKNLKELYCRKTD